MIEYEIELLTKTFKLDNSLLHYLPLLVLGCYTCLGELPKFEERQDFILLKFSAWT
jgi:hypothetical protein